MKADILEYYPNGELKHKIEFHDNGCKYSEQYFDQQGQYHNESGIPDIQLWYDNGIKWYESYLRNGCRHNICNPARIWHTQFGKIRVKNYYINNRQFNKKLNWQRHIKNI